LIERSEEAAYCARADRIFTVAFRLNLHAIEPQRVLVDDPIDAAIAALAERSRGIRNRPAIVVTLSPNGPAARPLTVQYLREMRRRTQARPSLGADSVNLVREMRDEEP